VKPARDLIAPFVVATCVALPWLNPFTSGPNSTVAPLIFAWFGASGAMLCWALLPQTGAQRLQTVSGAWVVAACVSAVLGLLQYFDISRDWAPWVNQPGAGQAFGNLRQRNQFATLCSMGLAAVGWWAQQGATASGPAPHQTVQKRLQIAALPLAALLGTAIAASGSRTGFVQLLLLLGLAWLWRVAQRAVPFGQAPAGWVFAVAVLAYGLAVVALPRLAGVDASVLDRLSENSGQCTSRLNLWRNVLYLIAQKPLWGWGWGDLDFAHFVTLYDVPWAGLRFCEILDNAHNLPLHLAVELGVPVAVVFCTAVLVWIQRQRPWRESRPERQLAWAVLAVIGVHSLLEYPLWYGQFQIAALLCLSVLMAFPQASAGGLASPAPAMAWGRPALIVGIAIGLGCAVASRSYTQVSQPYLPPAERAVQFRQASWAQLRNTWLFSAQVDFAELAVTPVTPVTAERINILATELLHFSPEPMVVQKLLQSAQMQGKIETVEWLAPRFEAAFPDAYAQWLRQNK
jgi:O-antigen ligase